MVVNQKAAPRRKGGRIWAALDAPSYQHCDTHGNELDRLFGMDIPCAVSRQKIASGMTEKWNKNGQSLE